jgi:ABC-type nitrate/sulfonate/bicarbonate transport system permease component
MWILLAARSFRSADLFGGVIVLGLIGYASAQLLGILERRLLRWRV